MGKKISESVYILAMVAVIAIVGIFVMTLVHSKSLINSAEWQEEQNLGGEAIKQKTTSSSTSIILSNNWYVDNAANPDGDGRSWKSAWNSFQAIRWGSIRPGDTIYVSGGANGKTYMETLWVLASGIPGSPITITKGIDPGHSGNVIIDVRNLTYVAQGVYVRSAKHVIISNFKVIIDDELRTALYVRGDINEYIPELASSHITIQNMEIQNELNMGIVITTSDNIRLNNNIIKSIRFKNN